MIIRDETPSDCDAIDALTTAAFETAKHTSHTEHFIVAALRRAGKLSVSLVAHDQDHVVGHVAISPVALSTGAHGWYGLGPVSVSPERQKQGIGSRLIKQALTDLRESGAAGCVVLGDPKYYSRFGFAPAVGLVLPSVPPRYFLALAFGGACPVATVSYHEAFAATA